MRGGGGGCTGVPALCPSAPSCPAPAVLSPHSGPCGCCCRRSPARAPRPGPAASGGQQQAALLPLCRGASGRRQPGPHPARPQHPPAPPRRARRGAGGRPGPGSAEPPCAGSGTSLGGRGAMRGHGGQHPAGSACRRAGGLSRVPTGCLRFAGLRRARGMQRGGTAAAQPPAGTGRPICPWWCWGCRTRAACSGWRPGSVWGGTASPPRCMHGARAGAGPTLHAARSRPPMHRRAGKRTG